MFQSPPALNKPPSSSSWSSWSTHPSIDYSFKHSFAWPHGTTGSAQPGGAASAASAAEAASHAHAQAHRTHGMLYHYHGRGQFPGYHRHHRRGGRRFIWVSRSTLHLSRANEVEPSDADSSLAWVWHSPLGTLNTKNINVKPCEWFKPPVQMGLLE